jgi:recombination protein RecA
MNMEENRKKALAAALSQIEKQFGKGSVMRLGDAGATYEVDSIPTGSLGLDIALGVGGIPRGLVIEISMRNMRSIPFTQRNSASK